MDPVKTTSRMPWLLCCLVGQEILAMECEPAKRLLCIEGWSLSAQYVAFLPEGDEQVSMVGMGCRAGNGMDSACNKPGLLVHYSTPSAPAPTLGIEPVCPSARPCVVLAPARQWDCECSLLSCWRHLRRTSGNPRLQHPLSGQVSAPAVAAARNHTAATRSLHPPLPVGGGLLFLSFFFFSFGVLSLGGVARP